MFISLPTGISMYLYLYPSTSVSIYISSPSLSNVSLPNLSQWVARGWLPENKLEVCSRDSYIFRLLESPFSKNENIYLFIYLFILERGRGRMTERDRNIHQLGASHTPWPAAESKPGPVPWPGIDPMTFLFAGWRTTNWATPGRAGVPF